MSLNTATSSVESSGNISIMKSERETKTNESQEAEQTASALKRAATMTMEGDNGNSKEASKTTDTNQHCDATASKRAKITDERTFSPLIENSDILKNVYTFLTIKDALEVRRTCRHLRDNDIDLFQYSSMMPPDFSKKYEAARNRIIYNLGSLDKFRAVILNPTFPWYESKRSPKVWNLIQYSETDNAAGLKLLLQDEFRDLPDTRSGSFDSIYDSFLLGSSEEPKSEPSLDPEMLDEVLKKNFVAMAQVLQQNEGIQSTVKMCALCFGNVGCYTCTLEVECCNAPSRRNGRKWDFYNDDLPHDYVPPKYCRACVLEANTFCGICSEFTCPPCIQGKKYRTCSKCKKRVCFESWGECSGDSCYTCKKTYCGPCNKWEEYIPADDFGCCSPCRRKTGYGVLVDDPWTDEDD